MRVRLYCDETISIRLEEIAANLGRLAPQFTFAVGRARFSVIDDMVINPETYRLLDYRIAQESSLDDEIILFTEKPYDNNYFWDSDDDKKTIVSLYGWDHLTELSRNNGAVYFICALLVRSLEIGAPHRQRNTGCINDFWRDKTGVDRGMRAALLCESCVKGTSPRGATKLSRVQSCLDDLGSASRNGQDICDFWSVQARGQSFDVFLCHNSDDKPAVRELNGRLQANHIKTWLDEEQLPPGLAW